MLQIAVDGLESAVNAINGGADELELCNYLSDGGLTPSPGLVKEVQELIRPLPVGDRPGIHVTIRCRAGDDFLYTDLEMTTMLRDVKFFKEMDVDGFVFGALTENRELDEYKCMKILAIASPKNVTFSRAFDHVREFKKSASILVGLGFHRVKTSGLRRNLNQPGAIKNLSFLATRYNRGELSVMPAGGVSTDNVGCFINMGCNIIHSTCRNTLQFDDMDHQFKLGITDRNSIYMADFEIVRELKECIVQAVIERERDMGEEDYHYE